ncbi:hypothetical protein QFC21_002418 [Naganishia friedmannii]|uniref:Uncharacterized protein n=1 Tax=Naganishia friedmannii TaxID=89922 RepID=A0ACC2VXX0_9TREE|nr:hypothetical protein QFC21_002418 [Naganishia friedmannii]
MSSIVKPIYHVAIGPDVSNAPKGTETGALDHSNAIMDEPITPPPHRDPIIFDTLILLAIQSGFYLLSRRFLAHALPTLRSISKEGAAAAAVTSPVSPRHQDGEYAMRSFDGTGRRSEVREMDSELDEDDEEDDRLLNASGGFSDIEAGMSHRSAGSITRQDRFRGDLLESDSEDDMSDITRSYAGSPVPSPSLGLPPHGLESGMHSASTMALNKQENGMSSGGGEGTESPAAAGKGHARRISALQHTSPIIRTPGSAGAAAANPANEPGGRKRAPPPPLRVLRLFQGRQLSTNGDAAGRAGLQHGEKEKEKVGATRSLGWLSRNLFSLCFVESLTLVSIVMLDSFGLLHARIPPYVTTLEGPSSSLFSTNGTLLDSLFGHGNMSQNVNGTRRVSPPPGYRLKGAFPQKVHLGNVADLKEIGDTLTPSDDVEDTSDDDDDDNNEYEYDQDAYEKYEYAFEYYSQQQMWRRGGWLEPSLGRVVVCGVVVLGGLSGLGAVRTAWNFIEGGGLGSGRLLTREDLISAERSLYRIRHDMVYKQSELARRLGGGAEASDGNSGSSHGWMGRVFASTLGRNQETNSLRREIQGLGALESQVKRGLEAMKLRRCFTSILFPPLATSKILTQNDGSNESGFVQEKGNTNGDWISYLIAWGLSQLPTGVADVAVWSRAISLLLTGLLILSSLLQVLRSVAKVLRLTSKRIGAGFLLLTLGQLMSTYTISLLIQLRSFIPPSMPDIDVGEAFGNNSTTVTTIASQFSSHGETSLLASLPEFRVFGRLFDVMFLIGAISTALYRYMSQKMNGVDEYAQVYH